MRSAIWSTALVLALLLTGQTPARAAVPGYDSAYAGESAFLNIGADPGQFQVFFMNTGTTPWRNGTASQVNLTVCLQNKVTCNVDSPLASWNDGSWLSSRAYATHTQQEVMPGQLATFVYNVKAPREATSGTYRFNGDLALAATGQQIHPQGYYQEATLAADRLP